jgi:hypothetical protein
MRLPSFTIAVAAVVALTGCATAIRGTTQRIGIATDPPGARCELFNARSEAPVVVDPTPGIVEVRRDNSDLEVRCAMSQRLLMVERFASSWSLFGRDGDATAASGQVAGSAVTPVVVAEVAAVGTVGAFGALGLLAASIGATLTPVGVLFFATLPVGAVVDHGTGASYLYPTAIAILMPPAEFPEEAARAAYFDSLERARRDAHALRQREREASCLVGCARDQAADDAELARQLELLETIRARTRVVVAASNSVAPRPDPVGTVPAE